jgi:hypothetical protein
VGGEALFGSRAKLGLEDGIGGDTFLLDEFLNGVQRLLGPVTDEVASEDGDPFGCFLERHFWGGPGAKNAKTMC